MKTIERMQEKREEEDSTKDLDQFDDVALAWYDITSYGVDFDVEGLVRRIQRKTVLIPRFQRGFVWKIAESSRFIESLLLGLPVPGIFLSRDKTTGELLVIDGQQRLLTLRYFYEGRFHDRGNGVAKKMFRLSKVQGKFAGKTYEQLDETDKNNLDNSIIHATVVQQNVPDNDDGIYNIFERLNSGGQKLKSQEIRTAVFHGSFIELIKRTNDLPAWRSIFGKKDIQMRDQELILRFFAMLDDSEHYKRPMVAFLNNYVRDNRHMEKEKRDQFFHIFQTVIDLFVKSMEGEKKLFRIAATSALNIAFFEASMVGLAKRIRNKEPRRQSR